MEIRVCSKGDVYSVLHIEGISLRDGTYFVSALGMTEHIKPFCTHNLKQIRVPNTLLAIKEVIKLCKSSNISLGGDVIELHNLILQKKEANLRVTELGLECEELPNYPKYDLLRDYQKQGVNFI
ncbi:MAG: hypothetical protein ACRCXT_06735 [Paraclostridium sp.]